MKSVKSCAGCLLCLVVIVALIIGGLYYYKVKVATDYLDKIAVNLGIAPSSGLIGGYQLGLVEINGTYYVDSYGNPITLINNPNAVDPTYSQLISFLQKDNTDSFPYQTAYANQVPTAAYGSEESHVDIKAIQAAIENLQPYPSVPRICSDFAERLYNDSEMAGIKCGYVSIQLQDVAGGHALDAYQTIDKGLVYIDDTGVVPGTGQSNCDKIVNVQLGHSYIPQSLFPEVGWDTTWDNLGVVASLVTVWGGTWN